MSKSILVTGENSYIGNSFVHYAKNKQKNYTIHKLSLRENKWMDEDFTKFDVIIHLAGIAHIKETPTNRQLYFDINKDLALKVARKAKKSGVKQFIFFSTMSVYGKRIGKIDSSTKENPNSAYGMSKLEAEKEMENLNTKNFKLVIIRPPMVYGPDCPGNYNALSLVSKKICMFPSFHNSRSMIFVDNLSELLINIIDKSANGKYFPQNKEYVCTSDMIEKIAEYHNMRVRRIDMFNRIIHKLNIGILHKIFGDLTYSKELSETDFNYQVVEFEESIILSEKGNVK
ncbi:NAD-dependent epimerase/dehydratase family protein [Fundicoccus sp. Sow4_D5]|uniref:NAD-dependent epimerase/dehydratase family protein n=1 Tax=Fundicoccus sp. Sow4_D5 TaxID=3438782 RepID=UPI003F93DB9D